MPRSPRYRLELTGVAIVPVLHVVVDNSRGDWDFGWDSLVAIGTLALALFTVWLAWSTRRLAKQTSDEVAADFRPVLIDAQQGTVQIDYPQVAGQEGTTRVAVQNVGPGPAMNTKARLRLKFSDKEWSSEIDLGTIAPGQPAAAGVVSVPVIVDRPITAELECEYEDLAEKTHRTEFSYESDTTGGGEVWPQLMLALTKTRIPSTGGQ